MNHKDTLLLAHYYTEPKVQEMADFVGDSFELAKRAKQSNAKRVVFAAVRFMAETVKILNPKTQVILPHADSTCSLVTQTNIEDLKKWKARYPDHLLVSYINSSAEQKAISDWIVTSANVVDIVQHLKEQGHGILFANDRNMGHYLNQQFDLGMKVWNSVCIVHDAFKEDEVEKALRGWSDYPKHLIAHPESPLPVLKRSEFVGSTSAMLKWVEAFPYSNHIIYVATEEGLLYNMKKMRPDLDIRQAPIYSGCQCHTCPFMRMNTPELVQAAVEGTAGVEIDYLSEETTEKARIPLMRMMEFKK